MTSRSLKQLGLISEPKTVTIGILITRIGTIDIINEVYQAEVRIDSTWTDNQEILDYDPDKYWNPRIYATNVTKLLKEEVKYFTERMESGITQITERRIIKAEFWEKIELYNFPFDIQELSMEVSSKLTKDRVKLVKMADHFNLDSSAKETFIDQQKWKLFKFVRVRDDSEIDDLTILYNKKSINPFPHIYISCYAKRRPIYFVFNALLLTFLLTAMSLTIFAVNSSLPQARLQISITLLLTSVMFKWNTNRSLPTVSYLTSMDIYSIGCIIFICLTIIWHSIVGAFSNTINFLDGWFLAGFGVVFVISNIAFLMWIIYCHMITKKYYAEEKEFLAKIDKRM